MYINTLNVCGILESMKAQRNPLNSWIRNDTIIDEECGVVIGENDLDLSQRLIKAGAEHAKHLRMIQVWADVNMPRYYWSEADTYSFGTKNSCSTMHRLLHKTTEISKELFEYNADDEDVIEFIIERLNTIRLDYLHSISIEEKNELVRRAKQLLPEGFLQLRTWNTNYAELRNMYAQRKSHKLKIEWVDTFCRWVESLPYSDELITYGLK